MRNQTRVLLAAAAVSLLAATGCEETDDATQTTNAASTPATVAANAPEAPEETKELIYLLAVRGNPAFNDASDAELLELGHLMCDIIDDVDGDVRAAQLAMTIQMVSDGLDHMAEAAGHMFGAAVVSFCPEYEDQL